MKYVCLVYSDEEAIRVISDDECIAFSEQISDTGNRLGGQALQPIATATTVRVRGGDVLITDGPFAETKEQLTGFYFIEARDLNEAIRIASRIPPARVGSIEVRPIRELRPSAGATSGSTETTRNLGHENPVASNSNN